MKNDIRRILRFIAVIVLFATLIYAEMIPSINLKINLKQYFKVNIEINTAEQIAVSEEPPILNKEDESPLQLTPNVAENMEPLLAPSAINSSLPEATLAFVPVKISIPSIKLSTNIVPVEFKNNQLMAPADSMLIGWDKRTYPGDGTIIMDGHYDSRTGPAVGYNLKLLKVGDKIHLFSQAGKLMVYKVTELISYDKDKAPTEKIFGNNGKQRLNIITCGGTFDKKKGTYNKRLVVYSELEV